ncbi:hypothetical protein [Kangiella marina]|uniref:Poly-gamma-glutamate synthase PgsB n=1 Tax=Kangiella marina TaxID=1079178 RepID=A0ABP8IAT9_9GAMM
MKLAEHYFTDELAPLYLKVYRDDITQLKARYKKIKTKRLEKVDELNALLEMVTSRINTIFKELKVSESLFMDFQRDYSESVSEQSKRQTILTFTARLKGFHSRKDKKALDRYFDFDAVSERHKDTLTLEERKLAYLFNRLGYWLSQLSSSQLSDELDADLKNNISKIYFKGLTYTSSTFVQSYALHSASILTFKINTSEIHSVMDGNAVNYIALLPQDPSQPSELQQYSLSILGNAYPEIFTKVVDKLLSEKEADIFLLAHLAKVLSHQPNSEQFSQYYPKLTAYPSDFVRQQAIKHLPITEFDIYLSTLGEIIEREVSDKVAAVAIDRLSKVTLSSESDLIRVLELCFARLANSDFVAKVALRSIRRITASCTEKKVSAVSKDIIGQLVNYRKEIVSSEMRRLVSLTINHIWAQSDSERKNLLQELTTQIQQLPLSKRKRLNIPNLDKLSNSDISRLLTLLSENDFPLNVSVTHKYLRVSRWNKFKFRLWRILYELKEPASDKRQGHKHAVGRVYYDNTLIASPIMAEQTQTKVPGEPVFDKEEGGNRQFLPLVDELISCLDQNWPIEPFKIYSTDGVTTINPPKSFIKRMIAKINLTVNFAKIANLRNSTGAHTGDYIAALRRMGFEIRYNDYLYQGGVTDKSQKASSHPSIAQFFSIPVIPLASEYWANLKNYFNSIYANNLTQLTIFIIGIFSLFFLKHAWVNSQINRVRKGIPLSIGGWGTRGKSGTERLKAAVFSGLGLNVVSKTTGCEAMFLTGRHHQKLNEVFLFRPYDKATIWEQSNLLNLSHKLKADVFLWECMGLTPSYVHILQKHWMRDDYATITNTYPDHEDVQGPAGYDIPKVMTEFIPKDSTLITTEELMYPILNNACRELNTECHKVSWYESGIITDDVLERFPYEEHPNNIALVVRLCELLGVSSNFALKAMADHVVLDLGVLKTYPVSHVNDRTLIYVMGNSANERLGAIGNWQRMKFDQFSIIESPGSWVSTVINNRADRVPRSKVFAEMLLRDLYVDSHYLIGTNLNGFMQYLREAWEDNKELFYLYEEGENELSSDDLTQKLQSFANKLRVHSTKEHVTLRLSATLAELSKSSKKDIKAMFDAEGSLDSIVKKLNLFPHYDDIKSFYDKLTDELKQYEEVVEKVRTSRPNDANKTFSAYCYNLIKNKVIVIEDPHLPGESILKKVIETTPIGITNNIMGLQNIKGTGLDFVYRWEAWEKCSKAITKVLNSNTLSEQVTQAVDDLVSFKEYGALSFEAIAECINQLKKRRLFQDDALQQKVTMLEENYSLQLKEYDDIKDSVAISDHKKKSIFEGQVASFLEKILDLGDAVRRRKNANSIYKDLANNRISVNRAISELKRLNKRQKGGWLTNKL